VTLHARYGKSVTGAHDVLLSANLVLEYRQADVLVERDPVDMPVTSAGRRLEAGRRNDFFEALVAFSHDEIAVHPGTSVS